MNKVTETNPGKKAPEHIAALDLGTNACRLLIAEKGDCDFKIVESFVRMVRLGDELATKGHISKEAILRATSALHSCAKKLKNFPNVRGRYVATAACRMASNADEFINTIRQKTGLELEIISTEEEARLAILGCFDLIDDSTRYAVAFDIGGGSTEVMWMELIPDQCPEIIEWISLPFGVVTVGELLRNSPSPATALEKVRKAIAQELKSFCDKAYIYPQLRKKNIQLVGTRGTVTTIAAIHKNLERYDRLQVHGVYLTPAMVKNTLSQLHKMTLNQRLLHPCIGPMRAELIMGGIAIFEGIYDVFPIDPLRVADRGVREGILVDLMMS